MTRISWIRAITLTLAATLMATALSGTGVLAQSGKVGGTAEPVTLSLIVEDVASDFTTDVFVDAVEELSGGSLTIHDATDDSPDGGEGNIATRVQSGDADIGSAFVRDIGEIGGSEFQALLAPFLVTDAALLKAIATGPIGADMLAGLEDEGLVGLTLVPGDRRFILGFERPLITLADFAGTRIGIPPTTTNDAFIRALGAEPMDLEGAPRAAYLRDGAAGQVTVLRTAESDHEYLTSNLPVHAVPVVWFANAEVMAELSPEQRAVLIEAARRAQEAGSESLSEVEPSSAYCATGGHIVEAIPEDVAAIVAAAQPVIEMLANDPVTAGLMGRIGELKAGMEPARYPEPCGAPGTAEAITRIPDGRYEAELTRADALQTGWPDECVLGGETGRAMLVIEGTAWTQLQGCGDQRLEVGAHGTFEYVGDELFMREPGIEGWARFAWTADGDVVTLKVLEVSSEDYTPMSVARFLFEHAFTRAPS